MTIIIAGLILGCALAVLAWVDNEHEIDRHLRPFSDLVTRIDSHWPAPESVADRIYKETA